MTASAKTAAPRRLLTIGAVRRRLQEEFPDVSISKIRYLEDQGLLAPQRTQGGYRLFSEEDVERLETILRLQRDEFLPLRVIREELSSPSAAKTAKRRSAFCPPGPTTGPSSTVRATSMSRQPERSSRAMASRRGT